MAKMSNDISSNRSTMVERYHSAKLFMQGYMTNELVQNDTIFPNWINGSNCFWYIRTLRVGDRSSGKVSTQYRLVDAELGSNKSAFNHDILASKLAKLTGESVDPENLPISDVEFLFCPVRLVFSAFNARWVFDTTNGSCRKAPSLILGTESLSPNGTEIVFQRDHNIWVRNVESGQERALTHDGEEDLSYGARSSAWGMSLSPEPPGLWSPDGNYLLSIQRDRRDISSLPMVDFCPSDGSIRPNFHQVKVAYPGDEIVETYKLLVLEVQTGMRYAVKYQPIVTCLNDYNGFLGKLLWWSADSKSIFFIDQERGDKVARLVEAKVSTGLCRVIFEETSDTHVNILTDVAGYHLHKIIEQTNELIWWSERSGWGHLYLYDLTTGRLKNQITGGNWRVRDVLHVDELRREIWIQTSGRISKVDPYYRDVCRVNLDTGRISIVATADAELVVHYNDSHPALIARLSGRTGLKTKGVSPGGQYVVITESRVDCAPKTELFDRQGNHLLQLDVADVSSLPDGWTWPEPVEMDSADGITKIYGVIFRPSHFSVDVSYPIINYIVSSPWLSVVPKGSFHNSRYADRHYFFGAALAELGFVVVLIDGRGTPLRSKLFQDESYGWIPSSANQDDHVFAIRQLSSRYPYMDLDRVGVFAQGYRSGLQSFLERQDFYKVCVSMSVLDNRLMSCSVEGDKFEGRNGPQDDKLYPEDLVSGLKGKLFLMHAMNSVLSPAYPPSAMFRIVESLKKNDKKFDMLVVPDGGIACTSYMFRRAWDFLVTHLQDSTPPKEFNLTDVHM